MAEKLKEGISDKLNEKVCEVQQQIIEKYMITKETLMRWFQHWT